MLRPSLWLLLTLSAPAAIAQVAPDTSRKVAVQIDSGFVDNSSADPAMAGTAAVVYSTIVHIPNASWLRLSYGGYALPGNLDLGNGAYLRITSLRDGAVQTQHAVHVEQWRETSAYFNGDAVRVEILAFPGTGLSRIMIDEVTAGDPPMGDSICGATDDRTLSSDPRTGRNQPTGCTSWMINDCNTCFLTAGHCTGNLQVVQFNVPLSNPDGSLNHPPPSDQYAVDATSLISNGGQGVGDDWAYFGVFANSTTGLHPFQANGGQAFTLVTPPPVTGQNIRITGYGTVGSPVSPTFNQVQKTHVGPYFSFFDTTVRYTTDTTGGNSGSPIIDESTGNAIGIHTHAGCDANPGTANHGTGSNHPMLQLALINGGGVCSTNPTFATPNGVPDVVAPAGGDTVRVTVAASTHSTPVDGTGMLHVDSGSGFQATPMQQVSPGVYDAVFPALACGARIQFYFSVDDTNAITRTEPAFAPVNTYSAIVAATKTDLVAFDFETTPVGWTVTSAAGIEGAWVRAVPAGSGGARSDPPADFDGSGACWVTGNNLDEDLDGGPTVITTPTYDLSSLRRPHVRYARWMRNDDGDDELIVEVDDGSGWQELERVGDTIGWVDHVASLDFLTDLSAVRFRFTVADEPNNSVTEAAIDAFQLFDVLCVNGAFTTFGTGCAGSAGTPTLDIAPGDVPLAGESYDVLLTNLPASGGVFGLIGFSNTSFPPYQLPVELDFVGMPNCFLYIDIFQPVTLTNAGGSATWTLALPGVNAAIGATLFQQGFAIDTGGVNALGATVTNAAEVDIGG